MTPPDQHPPPDDSRRTTDGGTRGGRRALRLDTREHAPRVARLEVADLCGDDLPASVVADVQLITSELVTNALEHGVDGVVTLDLKIDDDTVTVIVTSAGAFSESAPKTNWSLPDATQRSGRGLALARELAERVDIHFGDGLGDSPRWVAVKATLRLE